MWNRKDTYIVYTLLRLTPLKYLPCYVFNQMVSTRNKYARGKLVLILLVIGMINFPNIFQQTLYNINKT